MEIRILQENEIPQAAKITQGVFDFCLSGSITDQSLVDGFLEYSKEVHIRRMAAEEKVILWGVFEQGQMAGMSAMQAEGHITMLYVLPAFQRRGYGKRLLETMRIYGRGSLGLEYVTVNAMPVYTAAYFLKRKFVQMNNTPGDCPFVPMYAGTIEDVQYEKKELSQGWILGTTLGGLAVCAIVVVIFMISYLHGLQ